MVRYVTTICLILSACAAPALAGDLVSAKPAATKCFVLQQWDVYSGTYTTYFSQQGIKTVRPAGDRIVLVNAPFSKVQTYLPKKNLVCTKEANEWAGRFVQHLKNLEIKPDPDHWRLLRHSHYLRHPTIEYAYADDSGLKGKAVFMSDIPVPNGKERFSTQLFQIPDLPYLPVQVSFSVEGDMEPVLSTDAIAEREISPQFFALPPNLKETNDISDQGFAGKRETKEIVSDFLGIANSDGKPRSLAARKSKTAK